MARFNGATWKGTYSSSPARYFRAYAEYELIDGANTYTIQVSELGIEKTSGGSAEMVANATKRATLTAKSGTTTVGTPISLSTSNALNFGASNPNAKSLGSGSIVINKTTSTQTITLEIYADKSGGDTSTAWGGKSTGTMQLTVPAYSKPVVTIATTRSTTTDTSATVVAKVSSFVGDTISNFVLNVGGSSQTLTGGTIPSSGYIERTVNLTNLATTSITCTLSARGTGGTSDTVTGVIQSAFRTLHFGAKGKSIGVGTSARETASANGNFDVAMDVNFTGKLQKNGVDIGTGGGGTTNYNDLSNKPVINGVTVSGEKALSDYGIASTSQIPTIPTSLKNPNALTIDGWSYDGSSAKVVGNTVFYGVCDTAQGTATKTVTIDNTGFALTTGVMVLIKFTNGSSVANPTLNINSTGAKAMHRYAGTSMSTGVNTGGIRAGAVKLFVYDGTQYVEDFWENSTYYTESCYITTSASTSAKVGTNNVYTSALANSYLQVHNYYANTAKSALTLNINSQGAKPIYINGTASSSTNNTLPAGTYFVYYDGTNYYFRTDGKLTVGSVIKTNGTEFTSNTGTITEIKMNGASKGTSGSVDLGTVLTSHQTLKTINNQAITGSGNITISGGTPTITKTAITPTMKSGYTLSSNSSYYVKELGLVVLNMTINGSIPNGTKEVLTLPSDYYPSQSISISAYRSSAYWITGYISTSGVITIRSNNATTGNVQMSASYWV